jgi:hypothetical protein
MEIKVTNEGGTAIVEVVKSRGGSDTARLAPGQSVEIDATKASLGEVEGDAGGAGWDQDREQVAGV